jgi:predicted nucleic-acid-binding protein
LSLQLRAIDFAACDRGDVVIVISPVVLAECVFVLESFYGHLLGDIAAALERLISSPGVEINRVAVHLDGLKRYKETKAHFVDCVIAATALAEDTTVARLIRTFGSSAMFGWTLSSFATSAGQPSCLSHWYSGIKSPALDRLSYGLLEANS